jgi:putative membrane protein
MPGLREFSVKSLFLVTAAILSLFVLRLPLAMRGSTDSVSAPSRPGAALSPVDTYFLTQTSLGTPFQIDSGRLAETKATMPAIRSYAHLMVTSHITVNNALEEILKNKAPVPPPTLLKAAYSTMIWTLENDTGQTFDADYVRGQVDYQRANAALYRYEIANGTDPDLKTFAQETLPKIQDHFERALKLQNGHRVPSVICSILVEAFSEFRV